MKRIIVILSLVFCFSLANAQEKQYALPYNLSDAEESSSIAAGAIYQDKIEISGKDGMGGLYNFIAAFNGSQIRGNGTFNGGGYVTLVDGVERDPGYLRPQEIESITVLKDAASLALYGLKGANGAIVIRTKRGLDSPMKVTAEYHYGMDFRYGMPEMASSAEYMQAVNEALANDGLSPRYSNGDISAVAAGTGLLGANDRANDWESIGLRNFGDYHDLVLSAQGGQQGIRYYVQASYVGSHGMYANVHYNDGYTLQSLGSSLDIRSNIEARLTDNTTLTARVKGRLTQQQGPNGSVLGGIYSTPRFLFPQQIDGVWTRSQMFGNPAAGYLNGGYYVNIDRALFADLGLTTDLSQFLKGLKWNINVAYDTAGNMGDSHSIGYKQNYITYDFDPNAPTTTYTVDLRGNDTGMGFSGGGMGSLVNRFSGWSSLDWQHSFGAHNLTADLVYSMEHYKGLGGTNVAAYINGSARLEYNYADRYIINMVGTVASSGRAVKPTFLPAVSLAWIISNEGFLRDSEAVNFLKLRASYGKTAYDGTLGYDMDKQFNGGGKSYMFMAKNWSYGFAEGDLPSSGIVPQIDTKANVGLDMRLFDCVRFTVDQFYNHRTQIPGGSSGEYSSVLGVGTPTVFNGECASWGTELTLGFDRSFGDFGVNVLATAVYANSKIIYIPQGYVKYDYQNQIGKRIGSNYHLEADGFYLPEDFDADGNLLPGVVQTTLIEKVQPGDVKYVDQNGDGIIDGYDKKYMNYSATPYWTFGLNLGARWKNFGIQTIFDAYTGSYADLMVNNVTKVLVNDNTNISKYALKHYWYEGNEDNALFPRLTTLSNNNNYAVSTLWLRKADRIKFETLYLYYDLNCSSFKKNVVSACRFYLRGRNLFTLAAVEPFVFDNIGNGYATRSFELGARLTF